MNNEQEFKEIITNNKRIALKKLIQEMNDEKLVFLQMFLNDSNIDYDRRIYDYYKLVNSLKRTLDKDTKKIVLDKCNQIDRNFQELIDGLSNGSTNSFNKFIKNAFNIVKPISVGLAINTAVQLAPTPVTKLVPMGIGALYGGYKLCKNHKSRRVIEKDAKLNLKIQNREFKYDGKNNLVDTRFTSDEQSLIRAKLKEMNIDFKDFGYQSLRSVIYSLPYEKKIDLVMYLEGKTNRNDFLKELKKYNSISSVEKHRFVPVTTVLTAETLEQLGLMNIIQTTGLVALNGLLVQKLTSSLTDSKTLGVLAGLMTSGATLTGLDSPIIQAETVLISIIIAEIIRVFAKTIRSIKNGINNKKITKKFLEIEKEKYSSNDNDEEQLLKDYMNNFEVKNYISENIIIELITNYIRNNLKVDIKDTPKNIYQLGLVINRLKPYQKRKIHKLMEEFKYFNKHPNNQFKHNLEKMLKVTGMTAILGLAGMSIADIFTKGELLKGITEKYFFVDAPEPFVIEVEHTKQVTNDPGIGLVRNNESGEHILETTYTANVGNEAFNTHCNYYHDPNWLMEQTGMTLDEYMGRYTLEDYQNYKSVADILVQSPYFSEADINQINNFKQFLEIMIAKRERAQILSEVGIGVATASSLAGLVGRDKDTKDKIPGTVHKKVKLKK